jgi:hypothetical protein
MLACALKAVYGVLFLVEPTLSFLIATHEFGVSADTNKASNPVPLLYDTQCAFIVCNHPSIIGFHLAGC